jgi:hypothetical protein
MPQATGFPLGTPKEVLSARVPEGRAMDRLIVPARPFALCLPDVLGSVQSDFAIDDASSGVIELERIRISFFEDPLFCPSLQGETMGREGLMRVHNRVDLGARTWYRHALWQPPFSGSTKTPSSKSSAITGSLSSNTSPRYQDRHVQAVIDKMLGCDTPEAGYTTYLCPHCLEEKRVAFSCKSSFCLSCCKVYVDEWVSHIDRTLYEGVSYRHVVLTMPEALHIEFYRDRPLLAGLMIN